MDDNGALLKGGAPHPIIEDDVVIYAGATILGRITIGRGATIGGNVCPTRSVPPRSNITQAHARSDIFVDGSDRTVTTEGNTLAAPAAVKHARSEEFRSDCY